MAAVKLDESVGWSRHSEDTIYTSVFAGWSAIMDDSFTLNTRNSVADTESERVTSTLAVGTKRKRHTFVESSEADAFDADVGAPAKRGHREANDEHSPDENKQTGDTTVRTGSDAQGAPSTIYGTPPRVAAGGGIVVQSPLGGIVHFRGDPGYMPRLESMSLKRPRSREVLEESVPKRLRNLCASPYVEDKRLLCASAARKRLQQSERSTASSSALNSHVDEDMNG